MVNRISGYWSGEVGEDGERAGEEDENERHRQRVWDAQERTQRRIEERVKRCRQMARAGVRVPDHLLSDDPTDEEIGDFVDEICA